MLSFKAKVNFLTASATLVPSWVNQCSPHSRQFLLPLSLASNSSYQSLFKRGQAASSCYWENVLGRSVCPETSSPRRFHQGFWSDVNYCRISVHASESSEWTHCLQNKHPVFVDNRGLAFPKLRVLRPLAFGTCRPLFFSSRRTLCAGQEILTVFEPAVRERMADEAAIELDEQEKQLFKTLLGTLKFHGLQTQLRVAGGWVRDKLLGKPCKDIDIALDDMLGKDFADKVNEYLVSINEETHTRHVIQSNPDQSKHLETASMMVHGTSVDFVNLRAEEYASGSRIPTMVFGTPEQDAYRRDLTINSLFYNINTESVEDFTKQGLADLRDGIIRTPLPPVQTFLDDPLRVLRAVRFGSRFGFRLDADLVEAASSAEVRGALEAKVSRERVGIEVDKMLGGPNPELAMEHLSALQLFPSVFTVPPAVTRTVPPATYGPRCLGALRAAADVVASEVRTDVDVGAEERKLVRMAALFLPLRNVAEKDKKGKKVPVTQSIFMEALKLKADYARVVALLHTGAEEFRHVMPMLLPDDGSDAMASGSKSGQATSDEDEGVSSPFARKRIATGLLLKKLKNHWRSSLLLSSLLDQPATAPFGDELAPSGVPGRDPGTNGSPGASDANSADATVSAVALYRRVEAAVLDLGLERVWEVKPLLDGKSIMAALGIQGREMATWVDRAGKWQLAHPDGSADECRRWLQDRHSKAS